MATIYKVEVVSHWVNYSEEELQKKLEAALKEKGNQITVNVIERS